MPLKGKNLRLNNNHQFISLRSAEKKSFKLASYTEQKRFSLEGYKPRIYRESYRLPFAKKKIIDEGAPEANQWANEDTPHRWPVDPAAAQYVSSPFGFRSDPFTGERAFHAGIDIAAAAGTKVLATAGGTVSGTGSHARLGRYVRVDHQENEYSLYGHLSAIHVAVGQQVSAGDVIGEIGSTGRSTGPHLDYSLRRDGKPIDPRPYLPAAPNQQTAVLD